MSRTDRESGVVQFDRGIGFRSEERAHKVTPGEEKNFLDGLRIFSGTTAGANIAMQPETVMENVASHNEAHDDISQDYIDCLDLGSALEEGFVNDIPEATKRLNSLKKTLKQKIKAIHDTHNNLPKSLQSDVKGGHSIASLTKEYGTE